MFEADIFEEELCTEFLFDREDDVKLAGTVPEDIWQISTLGT